MMHRFERDVAEQRESRCQCGERSGCQLVRRRRELDIIALRVHRRDAIGELLHEIRGGLDLRKIVNEQQAASQRCVVSRTAIARTHVSMHRFHFHRRERVIDVSNVLLSKFSTVHQGF